MGTFLRSLQVEMGLGFCVFFTPWLTRPRLTCRSKGLRALCGEVGVTVRAAVQDATSNARPWWAFDDADCSEFDFDEWICSYVQCKSAQKVHVAGWGVLASQPCE